MKIKKEKFQSCRNQESGFSLIELIVSLVLTLIILGIAVTVFTSSLNTKSREGSKTDAITSAQAALNIMTREIGNSGYGLNNNGLVWTDSTNTIFTDSTNDRLHFRANTVNTNSSPNTTSAGEDVTFYYDSATESVVRYDANTGLTSGIINRVSRVKFIYVNYVFGNLPTETNSPTATTGKVIIELLVSLPPVPGQPVNQNVLVKSDVTLRNSPYMLGKY